MINWYNLFSSLKSHLSSEKKRPPLIFLIQAKAELVSADESVDVEEKAESAKSTLAAEVESDSEVGDGLEGLLSWGLEDAGKAGAL